MNISLVIFDFDGTIVNSEEGISNCVRHALKSIGIDERDDAKIRRFIGPPLFDSFMKYYGVDEETAARLVEVYRERYRPVGYRECEIYDGILELLDELRARGIKTAVASAKPQEFVVKICEEMGIDDRFDALVGAQLQDTASDKTRLLERAVRECGGAPAETIVMVGDSRFDIEAAKNIGAYAIGVEYGFGTREEFINAGADEIVRTVAELRGVMS